MSQLYIHRKLYTENKVFTEAEALQESQVLIILAEPGAGKTKLLEHFAKQLNVQAVRASIFRNRPALPGEALIIDAMDEVARVDTHALEKIIAAASDKCAGKVIFAGRSSEWDKAFTNYVKDCFGFAPEIFRLEPFNEQEQASLFDSLFPNENFDHFSREVQRLELMPLLGNPQFLELLGEAYIENRQAFDSKAQIFLDAVRRLAHETSETISRRNRPPYNTILTAAGEIFAQLMLSGATGVSRTEKLDDLDFPYLGSISRATPELLTALLDSRLFKPASDVDQHEPVHRIVAEYCAARYIVHRAQDPSDTLSLNRVVSQIAPNGFARDELRGLIGWIAALGNKTTQTKMIAIDPYAVLANGDPSQLALSSKELLLESLLTLSRKDPHFRGSDAWRTFNVGQFFTSDLVSKLRPLISSENLDDPFVELVLELLPGTDAARDLQSELKRLLLNRQGSKQARFLALAALLADTSYVGKSDLSTLIDEATVDSLRMGSRVLTKKGIEPFGNELVLLLLQQIARCYEENDPRKSGEFGQFHFVRQLSNSLSIENTVTFLDELVSGLVCTCNPKHDFFCGCNIGMSKIIGHLLDRYFSLASGPYDAAQIWCWIEKLRFASQRSYVESAAVKALIDHTELRREIYRLSLGLIQDPDEFRWRVAYFGYSSTHVGLRFRHGDWEAMAEYAFRTGNPGMWGAFWTSHDKTDRTKGKDEFRSLLRTQAKCDSRFMRVLASRERAWKEMKTLQERQWGRANRQYNRNQKRRNAKRYAYLEANREKIERGQHFEFLTEFASRYLIDPGTLLEIVNDVRIAESSLRNCFPFLRDHIPTLRQLSHGKGRGIAQVLHAACLLRFREANSLDGVDPQVLLAVKTDTGGYPTTGNGDAETFELEIDRHLFPNVLTPEQFIKDYLEPQLASGPNADIRVDWLNSKRSFQYLRPTLPLEWLRSYPSLPLTAIKSLFDMAVQYGDHDNLIALIETRLADCNRRAQICSPAEQMTKEYQQFWTVAAFFFIPNLAPDLISSIASDPEIIFTFEARAGRWGNTAWPPLSAEKIYHLINSYVDLWPKVPLPESYGTGSPKPEIAYRFLKEIAWKVGNDRPDCATPVINRMLSDSRFADFHGSLRTQMISALRTVALQGYRPPSPQDISSHFNNGSVASVHDLRALMLEELGEIQSWVRGAETDPLDTFYNGQRRVDENTARNRIVDRLQSRMTTLGLSVDIERHVSKQNRCDITVSSVLNGTRRLLMIEVKGQWHRELFTAASAQLYERYAFHPEAAMQGIYLALWFGGGEKIAGAKCEVIQSASQLREAIVGQIPNEILSAVDVVVLDLSRKATENSRPRPGSRSRRKASARS